MDKLDWFVKKELRIKNYFRYADDFVIVHKNQDYLNSLIRSIGNFLKEKLDLELHPQKVEIRKFNQGVDFLGYAILPHYTILRTKTKKRMFKKMRNKKRRLDDGLIGEISFNQSLQSYFGVLSHCNGYKLGMKLKEITKNKI